MKRERERKETDWMRDDDVMQMVEGGNYEMKASI